MRKLTCVEFWNRCIVRWRFSLFPMFRVWCWSRCLRRILLKRRQTAHFELGYTRSRKSCCSGLSWESGTVSFKVYVSSLVDVTFSRVSNYRFDAHYDVLKTLIVCNPDTIDPKIVLALETTYRFWSKIDIDVFKNKYCRNMNTSPYEVRF